MTINIKPWISLDKARAKFVFVLAATAFPVSPFYAGQYHPNETLPAQNMQVSSPSSQYDTSPKFVKGRAPFMRHSSLPGHDRKSCSVIIQFAVGVDGKTGDFRIVGSAGPPCAQLAIDAMKDWRFEPGRKHGKPVRVVMRCPFVLGSSYY